MVIMLSKLVNEKLHMVVTDHRCFMVFFITHNFDIKIKTIV